MKEIKTKIGKTVLVDDDIFEWIGTRRVWIGGRYPYIVHDGKERKLHRCLMDVPEGKTVDHVNRNPLDCRRENLRVATQRENSQNVSKRKDTSSRYKGVSWHAPKGTRPEKWKWQARIQYNGRLIHLGTFTEEREAALAYDAAAKSCFGEFAAVNFGYYE